MFQSIVAVTVGYSAEDSVHQGIFSQEAEAELDIRRWLGHRESVLGCVAGSVCPGSALRHSQRSHDANQVLTIWRNVRYHLLTYLMPLPSSDTVSCSFSYHTWQFIIFAFSTITACIISYSLRISFWTQDLALQQILSSIDLFLFFRTDYTDSQTMLNGCTGKCVRLSRPLVGFWTHFKSLHFLHSFIHFTCKVPVHHYSASSILLNLTDWNVLAASSTTYATRLSRSSQFG